MWAVFYNKLPWSSAESSDTATEFKTVYFFPFSRVHVEHYANDNSLKERLIRFFLTNPKTSKFHFFVSLLPFFIPSFSYAINAEKTYNMIRSIVCHNSRHEIYMLKQNCYSS